MAIFKAERNVLFTLELSYELDKNPIYPMMQSKPLADHQTRLFGENFLFSYRMTEIYDPTSSSISSSLSAVWKTESKADGGDQQK